jgi:hypothetical protein
LHGLIRPSAVAAALLGVECALFDGDGEPSDQPRHLVQLVGVMLLDGLRKPDEAFVVAHRRDVAGNDRGGVFDEIGLDVWHRITSAKSGTAEVRGRISHFSDQFRAQLREADRPARRRTSNSGALKKPNNPLQSAGFQAAATARQSG